MDLKCYGNVDCSGKSIIGALPHVNVIVRVNRLFACKSIPPCAFDCTIANDFVRVHVATGSRTSLEDINRKLRIPFSVCNFQAGRQQSFHLLFVER